MSEQPSEQAVSPRANAASAPAWSALDALEALGLITTGLLTLRQDPRRALSATATAVLLVTDAYLDLTTSAPGPDPASAIAMALFAELPIAALRTAIALRCLGREQPCTSVVGWSRSSSRPWALPG